MKRRDKIIGRNDSNGGKILISKTFIRIVAIFSTITILLNDIFGFVSTTVNTPVHFIVILSILLILPIGKIVAIISSGNVNYVLRHILIHEYTMKTLALSSGILMIFIVLIGFIFQVFVFYSAWITILTIVIPAILYVVTFILHLFSFVTLRGIKNQYIKLQKKSIVKFLKDRGVGFIWRRGWKYTFISVLNVLIGGIYGANVLFAVYFSFRLKVSSYTFFFSKLNLVVMYLGIFYAEFTRRNNFARVVYLISLLIHILFLIGVFITYWIVCGLILGLCEVSSPETDWLIYTSMILTVIQAIAEVIVLIVVWTWSNTKRGRKFGVRRENIEAKQRGKFITRSGEYRD